jgi:peroxiredoxin Q/BCP
MPQEGLLMAKLSNGDAAPDFALPDQGGQTVTLADFGGGNLLIYFYPKADTPGCTRQACSIRDAREELRDLGLQVVGISPDQPGKQQKFDDKYQLSFPLLADPDHRVAEAYGAWGEKNLYGKKSMGIIRSSFLIDAAGKIVAAWYGVKPEDTVPKAEKALRGG